jgi:hypothetical protein
MEDFWLKSLVHGGYAFSCDGDFMFQGHHTRVTLQLKFHIILFFIVVHYMGTNYLI